MPPPGQVMRSNLTSMGSGLAGRGLRGFAQSLVSSTDAMSFLQGAAGFFLLPAGVEDHVMKVVDSIVVA